MATRKYKLIIFFLIAISSLWIFKYFSYDSKLNQILNENDFNLKTTSTILVEDKTDGKNETKPDKLIKNMFDFIYNKKLWGPDGGGSGYGSDVNYTINTRNILHNIIKKYNISSMVDAPCGAMMWMPLLLANLSLETNKHFKYHGIDVVESVINASKNRFANFSEEWKFSVVDFSQQNIPENYDLIFSRDALQHLPLDKVINALEIFSKSKGSKYLAVGSYVKSSSNKNIKVGEYFPIDLTRAPFNLGQYIELIDEKTKDLKHIVLYDIPGYLSKIDYNLIRNESLRFYI